MPPALRNAVASFALIIGLAGVASGQPVSRAAAQGNVTAITAFLGAPSFTTEVVFTGSAQAVRQVESLRAANPHQVREPSLAVTTDGTLLALRNYAGLLRRSIDGGRTFEPAVPVPFGVYDSSFIVDDTTGDVLVLRLWDSHDRAWRSRDQGRTWVEEPITVRPNSVMRRLADEGAMRGTRDPGSGRYYLHANATESGITLRRGSWRGRLIVAATFRPHAKEHPSDRTPADATCSCAVFSDDGGRTWTVSEPFPEAYTEENALVELYDGRLYYNSRCCDGFFDKARARPLPPEASLRRTAWSDDGGATWRDLAINRVLPDGGGYGRGYGLKAGLVRLPLADRDVLLYSNTDTAGGKREKLTVWASFDGGRTWPVKRLVRAGPAAYSCLAAGRPGTADAGRIFLLFEGADSGVYDAIQLATFNLAWVLAGDRTGDGEPMDWAADPRVVAEQPDRAAAEASRLVDVPYGPHPRQVLHFWQGAGAGPRPLVFFVHGGGWVWGNRLTTLGEFLPDLLAAGLSVVSVEYRLVTDAIEAGVDPPVRWPLEDAARALQFVRAKAAAWNIDPARIGGAGVSAGGCTVLWLAYRDDMADPAAADPVARESTRLQCVAALGAQTTLDPAQMFEWTPNSRYGGHAFGFMDPRDRDSRDRRFDAFLAARERLLPQIERYSPFAHVSADDPPTYLWYGDAPTLGQPAADPTHTANFGVKLQERLAAAGVPCELHHPGAAGKHASIWEYLIDVVPRSNAPVRPREATDP